MTYSLNFVSCFNEHIFFLNKNCIKGLSNSIKASLIQKYQALPRSFVTSKFTHDFPHAVYTLGISKSCAGFQSSLGNWLILAKPWRKVKLLYAWCDNSANYHYFIRSQNCILLSFFFNNANRQINRFVSQSSRCPQCKTYKSFNGENYSEQCDFAIAISYQIFSQNQAH